MLTPDSLFDLLDQQHDGKITRTGLHTAARRLGWHWNQAPLFALLDLLTISQPLHLNQFVAVVQQIQEDPMGTFGRVLLNSPHFTQAGPAATDCISGFAPSAACVIPNDETRQPRRHGDLEKEMVAALTRTSGNEVVADYCSLLDSIDTFEISSENAALLIIDPQRAFTVGDWMQSIGPGAAVDVEPISIAFVNCAKVLRDLYGAMEIGFTRCPFPPGSYDWDERLANIIADDQLYFIKPGNNVLFPPLNGFREWATRCINRGIHTLVVGGCTLTSCVRVSSIEILRQFKAEGLRVVVDLSISGARRRNYIPSPSFNGISAVASAAGQMTAAGVRVARRVAWNRTSTE